MSSVMTSSDPSVTAAVAAAQDKIRAVVDGAIVEVANNLLFLMKSAGTYRERGQLAFAQIHILESRELFLSSFATALRDRVERGHRRQERGQAGGRDHRLAVDQPRRRRPDRGEDLVRADRPADRPSQRDRAARARRLHERPAAPRLGRPGDGIPCAARSSASALHRAIEKVTEEPETQKIFARELGQAMANGMPACYREISADLKRRAVRADRSRDAPGRRRRGARAGASDRAARHRLRGSAQGLGAVLDRPHGVRRPGRRRAAGRPRSSAASTTSIRPMRSTPRARRRCSIA